MSFRLLNSGRARAIGVSNHTIEDMEDARVVTVSMYGLTHWCNGKAILHGCADAGLLPRGLHGLGNKCISGRSDGHAGRVAPALAEQARKGTPVRDINMYLC